MNSIIFDLDNTLTHRDKSISLYSEEFIRFYESAFDCSVASAWMAKKIIEIDNGGYGGHDLRCQMLSELDIWSRRPTLKQLLEHWFSWFPSHPVPMPGMSHTLGKLKRAGFKLGIVTNGKGEVQRSKIAALGIGPLLDCIVISGEAGVKKPSIEIFKSALDKLVCEPREAIFVGDHPENDYRGSLDAGITPIWFSGFREWPEGKEPPLYTVDNLESIVGIVRDLTSDSSRSTRSPLNWDVEG